MMYHDIQQLRDLRRGIGKLNAAKSGKSWRIGERHPKDPMGIGIATLKFDYQSKGNEAFVRYLLTAANELPALLNELEKLRLIQGVAVVAPTEDAP